MEGNVGKAYDIETMKLRATYYNSIAAGTAVAGVFVPYFAFAQNFLEVDSKLRAFLNGTLDGAEIKKLVGLAVAVILAFILSFVFHYMALRSLRGFHDHD
jgi:amino acid permease